MKSSELRLAVVTQAPFPQGNVSTMRYSSYLKPLADLGVYSYVLIYCPTRMAAHIKDRSGIFEGINYQYATDITWKKYNILNKIWYLTKGLINSVSYLNQNTINTVILYGDNPFVVNFVFWAYTRITGKKYLGDRSELPSIQERKSKFKMLIYGLKQRMFDGMIVMTKQLMTFYCQYSKRKDFLFFLPMTIDPTRFDGLKRTSQKKPYIAVVFGTHNRDGLMETLQSYELYCIKGGNYDIHLIGDYERMPNKKELDKQLLSSQYQDRIHVLGKQSNERVPEILYNASALLTTPNNYVSGGFPTKLGEYMLSGVPIVATKAGELLDYIEPDVDMLICEPGDFDGISNSLLRVERDVALAEFLSENARNKAKTVFCADSYVNGLLSFITK